MKLSIFLFSLIFFILYVFTPSVIFAACKCGPVAKSTPCCPECPLRTPYNTFNDLCAPDPPAPPPASSIPGQSLGFLQGLGPLGEVMTKLTSENVTPASYLLASTISTVIGVITIVAGVWFLIQILIAGFSIISGSGDKNKVQEAQHKITNSIIGLTVVVAAYALTSLFGKILGIPNILNISAVIQLLGPK